MAAARSRSVINRRITHRTLRTECWTSEFWEGNGRSGNYIEPEIGFDEIAIDLLQARFWTASESAGNSSGSTSEMAILRQLPCLGFTA